MVRHWLSECYGNLIATLGIAPMENIVFGTDWPYTQLPAYGSDQQPELDLLGHARSKVDAEKANALVPRLCERVAAAGAAVVWLEAIRPGLRLSHRGVRRLQAEDALDLKGIGGLTLQRPRDVDQPPDELLV